MTLIHIKIPKAKIHQETKLLIVSTQLSSSTYDQWL